jgi:hypothetical protein
MTAPSASTALRQPPKPEKITTAAPKPTARRPAHDVD